MSTHPIDLRLTDRLKDHEFAIEYVQALEEHQRDSDRRYERRIAELERDAARYRYLRERDLDTIKRGGVFAWLTPKNVVLNGDDLDAAIDAALNGSAIGAEPSDT